MCKARPSGQRCWLTPGLPIATHRQRTSPLQLLKMHAPECPGRCRPDCAAMRSHHEAIAMSLKAWWPEAVASNPLAALAKPCQRHVHRPNCRQHHRSKMELPLSSSFWLQRHHCHVFGKCFANRGPPCAASDQTGWELSHATFGNKILDPVTRGTKYVVALLQEGTHSNQWCWWCSPATCPVNASYTNQEVLPVLTPQARHSQSLPRHFRVHLFDEAFEGAWTSKPLSYTWVNQINLDGKETRADQIVNTYWHIHVFWDNSCDGICCQATSFLWHSPEWKTMVGVLPDWINTCWRSPWC